jgi:drug/metabolite transporter (DMT)-like permease
MNFRGIWESKASGDPQMISSLILLSGIMILIFILSSAAIFLFKKRKIQMKLAGAIILLAIVHIGLMLYYIFWVTEKFQAELVPVYRMFIPVLILIFGILAYLGIRKDENLVKSLDRLR